jgi:hypothetical protein
LIPVWQYDVVLYGQLAVVAAALAYLVLRRRHLRSKVPRAEIVTSRWRRWIPTLALLSLIVCAIGAVGLVRSAHPAIRVVDTDRGPIAHRMKQLGDRGDADRFDALLAAHSTYVINDSEWPLRIETVHYASALLLSKQQLEIEPHLVMSSQPIDYVGPDDPPPKQIMVETLRGLHPMDSRDWLTWGPDRAL